MAMPNEKVNEEWEKIHEPSHNYSKANESKIETPEEEKRRKLLMLDNMVTDKINEKMESLKLEIGSQMQAFLAQLQNQQQPNKSGSYR